MGVKPEGLNGFHVRYGVKWCRLLFNTVPYAPEPSGIPLMDEYVVQARCQLVIFVSYLKCNSLTENVTLGCM